jgi:hypothetical protein
LKKLSRRITIGIKRAWIEQIWLDSLEEIIDERCADEIYDRLYLLVKVENENYINCKFFAFVEEKNEGSPTRDRDRERERKPRGGGRWRGNNTCASNS